ncbi:DUF4446 family protein [Lutispora sp.]|uniref:DUF4446 family protein n=1 Tax=Lutispora sp. TaxID=2828727 RepID=UPI0035647A31
MNLLELVKDNQIIILVCVTAIGLLLIWNIILSVSLSRLKGKYKKMMRGSTNKNLEQMMVDFMSSVDSSMERVQMLNQEIIHLKEQTDRCIQKVNITRYNAFSDTGSDMSYSIAMLDNYNNGVILTSIYGRNESVTYAKPIESGNSKYPLSVEEEMVLDRCLKNKR